MPNQEIITGLRNAIEHGESLQQAMQIMINSGYNQLEIREASKYVGSGVLTMQQQKPGEQLVMPEEKQGFFSKLFKGKAKQAPQITPPQKLEQESQEIKQAISSEEKIQPSSKPLQPLVPTPTPQPTTLQPIQQNNILTKELKKIKPPKQGRLKEIILLIILLVLAGVLITTIIFKDKILGWFG